MPSEAYNQARERIRAAKKEAQSIAKVAFKEEAIAVLDEIGAESFRWTQYTPYFNDGDACVFGVNTDAYIDGLDEYEVQGRPPFLYGPSLEALPAVEREEYKRKDAEFRAPYKRVAQFLNAWEEEDFLFMFGDHVEVTVTREGIQVEDYDHD